MIGYLGLDIILLVLIGASLFLQGIHPFSIILFIMQSELISRNVHENKFHKK